MVDDSSLENLPPTQKAEALYQKGMQLKNNGDPEAALTEFRRAVLADSSHFNAHFEIGLLCKTKADLDPVLLRHSFEAFRQAARLDLFHQEAHDRYIMMGRKMGRLDELLMEYDNWTKFNPENELLKRCHKNIVTISMALVPDKVNISGGQTSRKIGKLVLVVVSGLALIGIGLAMFMAFMKGKTIPQ